jgi:hypothetical protein
MASDKWVLEFYRNQKKVKEAVAAGEATTKKLPKGTYAATAKFTTSMDLLAKIKTIGSIATYIGIPAGEATDRSKKIKDRANKFYSSRKSSSKTKGYLLRASKENTVGNAQLLYWFSRGSYLNNQPARPVLEPSMHADGNRQEIAALVAEAVRLHSTGQKYLAQKKLKSAGARAAKAARDWFKDSRNGWAENALRTERRKGRNAPGLDTEIMRASITHVEKEISDVSSSNQNSNSDDGKKQSQTASNAEESLKEPETLVSEGAEVTGSEAEALVKSVVEAAVEGVEGVGGIIAL